MNPLSTFRTSSTSFDPGIDAPSTHHLLYQALVDEVECGLIVCNDQGAIRYANQAAQRELATARVLTRSGDRLQRAGDTRGELDTALRQAAQRGRRSLVRLDRVNDRLLISVLPFRVPGSSASDVLVMLGRRQPCSELGLEMLAASHGLTLAERRVFAALVRSTTPRQIAQQHAVSMTTVRTQIASIRAKFGAPSLDALLLRAAEVPPVASALRLAA